jgi:hypothetical protein
LKAPRGRASTGGRIAVGELLVDRARWVQERLTQAERLALNLGEETITESLLLDMSTALPGNIIARPYTRIDESRVTGADWEWWLGDGPGRPWFGMRVQAKKLKQLRAGVFGYDFGYTPTAVPRIRQVDRLIEAASRVGLPAVFALYNGPQLDLDEFAWGCCHFEPERQLLGVGLLSAEAARARADQGNMDQGSVCGDSRPWSCAALCPYWLRLKDAWPGPANSPPVGAELSLWAADLIASLLAAGAVAARGSQRIADIVAATALRGWTETPDYVQRLATDISATNDDRLDIPLPEDLGGVLLLTSTRGIRNS